MAWSAYSRRSFSGSTQPTHLTSNVDNAVTTLPVASTAGWPAITAPSTGFVIVVDQGNAAEEAMFVTAYTPNTSATVTRGFDGTTAVAHTSPATVMLCDSAIDVDEANQAVVQTIGKVTTAGDMIVASGPNAFSRVAAIAKGGLWVSTGVGAAPVWLPVGTDGQVLTADSTQTDGVKWGAVALSTVSSFIGANVPLTANTPAQVTSVSLTAGTWLVTGGGRGRNNSASVANFDLWFGPNSASITGALGVGTSTLGISADDSDRQVPIAPFTVVVASTTTYYLNAECSQSALVAASGLFVAANVASGVTCLKIA